MSVTKKRSLLFNNVVFESNISTILTNAYEYDKCIIVAK